jgi:hypothetical protein
MVQAQETPMNHTITKFPAVDIRTTETGGGHFNVHIGTARGFLFLNDGEAKQLYLALREIFDIDQSEKIAELTDLAVQYRDDLRHPPAPDSVKRRLERIKQVTGY